MKMSLQELFDVNHQTLFLNFASVPTHTAYTWAIARLKELTHESLNNPNPYKIEIAALRSYRYKAIKHYEGNLQEFYKKENPEVREIKVEPQLADLINTVA